ncbi:hypothetical protein GIB67_004586 [Kingdonia uniflora]|uniref:F-box domain-containing protein n=1 Tax=Kingdonia uniflora TaxID=39325 RepID=A0A7J7MJM4_9MAGN|nr:hypothetical protein GIB67_004586 [Kingdonia uniflora]
MDRITSDIVEEILTRIPEESLARCKCVCKPWITIIQNPNFNKTRFTRATKTNESLNESDIILVCNRGLPIVLDAMYLLIDNEESIKSAMFDVEPNVFDETWVMGSVKGFLCLSNSNDYLEFGDEQACYLNYIYNPLTRECVQLPQITFSVEHGVDIATGFGFVDSTNEFKVVKVFLGVGSRRNDGESVITSFDLKNEKWGVVHIPENMVLKDHSFYLGVLGGCLSIADCSFEDHIEIWIMKEYNVNESWARLFSVRIIALEYLLRNIKISMQINTVSVLRIACWVLSFQFFNLLHNKELQSRFLRKSISQADCQQIEADSAQRRRDKRSVE